jgi:hypothetical protein
MAINFLNNVDYNKNQLLNPRIQNEINDGAAGTPVEGQLYYNTTDNELKYGKDNGTGTIAWSAIDTDTGITSIELASAGNATSGNTITANGILTLSFNGLSGDYVNGQGNLAAFPTIPTVPSNIVETVVTTNSTYINLTPTTAASGDVTVTASLNAEDGTAVETTPGNGIRYLSKNNKWAEIDAIPGTYTWKIQGDTGGPTIVASSDIIDFEGGTNVTTSFSGTTLTIDATDTNDNDYLTALSFNTSDGVLTATVQNQSDVTVDLDGRYLTGNEGITLTGEVTGSGTTSIVTTVANGVLDVANFTAATIVTEADTIAANDNDTTIPTSAAVKAYADSLIVGGLIYQGGYNATTNIPDLTTSPNSILKGWTYTVTLEGTFFGEQLRAGDVLIAEVDDPSALTDWTTVQNNIDLASDTQVGIGNVKESTVDKLKGIDVTYNASGTAFVGLDIEGLALDTLAEEPTDYYLPIYDLGSDINNKAKLSELLAFGNQSTSKTGTIEAGDLSGTVDHAFGINTLVQTINSSGDTVYCDVTRTATTSVATIAVAEATDITILVQKIG